MHAHSCDGIYIIIYVASGYLRMYQHNQTNEFNFVDCKDFYLTTSVTSNVIQIYVHFKDYRCQCFMLNGF